MREYLLVLLVAAVITYAATPLLRAIAVRTKAFTPVRDRDVHSVPIPRLGGVAIFLGFAASMLVASQLPRLGQVFQLGPELQGILWGAAIVCLLGAIDDIRELDWLTKMGGQMIAAGIMAFSGVQLLQLPIGGGVTVLPTPIIVALTVFAVVLCTNAVNFIDGLDGLAAGIVAIGAGAYFIYARDLTEGNLLPQPNLGPLVSIITVGVCVGFLPFNFNPARVFMGDSGALLLGLLMAVSTSVVGGRADPNTQSANGQTYFFLAPIFISLLVLAVPIVDVLFAIVRRTASRRSIVQADMGHLHHRLIQIGHGPRRAVVILWGWAALLSTVVLVSVRHSTGSALVVLIILGVAMSVFTVLHPRIRRGEAQVHETDLAESEPHA